MALHSAVPTSPSGQGQKPTLVVTDRDIVFNCPNCRGELVVDREGSGLEVPCSHCGQRLTVPAYSARAAAPPAAVAPVQSADASAPLGVVQPAPASTPPPVTLAPAPVPAAAAPTPLSTVAAPPVEQPAAPTVQRTFNHAEFTTEQLARRWGELKHQLKENRSQDTEMRGHVNRATIELHRLQLRLKTLQDRHGDITAELTALQTRLDQGAA